MNKITFVCPSYNHEKYILDFLNSLLKQTCSNWELVIIDDCSQDRTAEIIKSVKDKRIRFIQNTYNQGINANLDKGIALAGSEIISLVASDDIIDSKYVQTILETFEKNKDISVCYTSLKQIDKAGKFLNKILYLPLEKSQEQIFAYMFLNENCIFSPGMAFKKSAIKPFLPLDTGLFQYSDYQLQLFLIYNYKIKLLKEPLVYYRISDTSVSYISLDTYFRQENETQKLMDIVVNMIGANKKRFLRYFGDHLLIKEKIIDSKTIPFWLGRLALTSEDCFKQKWGLKTIMNFISTQENIDLLNKLYGFSYKDYVKYSAMIKPDFKKQFKFFIKGIIKKYKKAL